MIPRLSVIHQQSVRIQVIGVQIWQHFYQCTDASAKYDRAVREKRAQSTMKGRVKRLHYCYKCICVWLRYMYIYNNICSLYIINALLECVYVLSYIALCMYFWSHWTNFVLRLDNVSLSRSILRSLRIFLHAYLVFTAYICDSIHHILYTKFANRYNIYYPLCMRCRMFTRKSRREEKNGYTLYARVS